MVWIKQIGFEWNATYFFLFAVSTLIMAELAIEMEKILSNLQKGRYHIGMDTPETHEHKVRP